MNSGHDLGGMMGFGPIDTRNEMINFHEKWEERVFALTLAMGATGSWNIDASRHARENMHPGLYTTLSYYRIWIAGLEKLLLDAALVTKRELAEGCLQDPAKPVKQILKAEAVIDTMMKSSPYQRSPRSEPEYKAGDEVLAKNMHPSGHTRIPRYVRGRSGVIDQIHGCHVFPDANAAGNGEDPHWLYKVAFSARDIWGEDFPANDRIFVDLWEPYLDPA